MKVPVSILIPVRNEAANLPRCLGSVTWADEIWVVDSQSTDDSVGIATARGAQVAQFHFNGTWPKKKNWALAKLPFKHEWVFILDADEVLPPEAAEEIRSVVTDSSTEIAGYWINRRFWFMGQWLRHAYYPNWNLRLFRHRLGRYEQLTATDTASGDNEVHEHVIVQGQTARLRCELDHYAFPSVEVFVEKHNRYSNWEARVAVANSGFDGGPSIQSQTVNWRRRLKRWSQRLPGRPLLRFLYVYGWQRGFLDGRAGYYFARLHGFYEFLSVAKTHELHKLKREGQLNPKSEGSNAATSGRSRSPLNFTLTVLFWVCLAGVLFFALRPSPHGERLSGLPDPMALWVALHDGGSNLVAFATLGFLGLVAEWRPISNGGSPSPGARSANGRILRRRLLWLLALVPTLELAQLGIPGRVFDWNDIIVGSLGVLSGWTAGKILGAIMRKLTSYHFGVSTVERPGALPPPVSESSL